MARVIGHDRSLSPFFRLLPSTAALSFLFNIPSNFLSFHSHRQKNQSSFPRSLQFEQSYADRSTNIRRYLISIDVPVERHGNKKKKKKKRSIYKSFVRSNDNGEKKKKKRWGSRFDREGKVIFEICN